jgi:uncharacterized protein (DUF1501 family)
MKPNSFSIINRAARPTLSRREILAGLGGLGMMAALPTSAQADIVRSGATPKNSAQVCIFINLQGAPSHVDTFDYKAGNAPPGHNIVTNGAITLNATLFPNLSALSSNLCLIRSMSSVEEAHPRGQWTVYTGHSSNPAFDNETPHVGAVVASELGVGEFPSFLALNGLPGAGAAFLGGTFAPTVTSGCGFPFFQHNFYGDTSQQRFNEKFNLLTSLDPSRAAPPDSSFSDFQAYYDSAKRMMYDTNISNVFVCSGSDTARYGSSALGSALLVARQAVQARNGVRFIHVLHQNWDTHVQMYTRGYTLAGITANLWDLSVELDRGLSALINDLKASGDFSRTLIIAVGEFGRTPGPQNGQAGRDHWKSAMCALMSGGGVAGGRVIGATDSIGQVVTDFGWSQNRSIYPQDIAATMYSALGIDWGTTITGTPIGTYQYCPIIDDGSLNGETPAPVNEVFA